MYKLSTEAAPTKARSEETDDESSVETSGCRIFFYSEVSKSSVLELNKQLRELAIKQINVGAVQEIPTPAIRLHINSPGGSLLDGFAAVDYIRNCKAPVHTVIDGSAASAATLMSVVATGKRYINKHGFMLIHQLSSGLWGKFEDQIDDMKNSELFMKTIYELYKDHTKIPEKTLKEILKRDLWFDAKTCIKYGLADEILN
jgi:ATP-dependent Clp endopeptidase proteolytic subunit ClpP